MRAIFPHTAFRCSSPQGIRLRPARCRRHFVETILQCLRQFRHKGGCPFFRLDGPEGHAVYPGAPFVGPDKFIGMTEDVRPVDLVLQGMEAAGWFLLGLAVELPLKCPDAIRGC